MTQLVLASSVKNLHKLFRKPPLKYKLTSLALTDESLYSTTKWKEADIITYSIINKYKEIINNKIEPQDLIITDANASVGGSSIAFWCNGFKCVNSVDIDKTTTECLETNLTIYGYPTKYITCADYTDPNIYKSFKQNIIYLDPPWGGRNYKSFKSLETYLSGIELHTFIIELINNIKIDMICIRIPINYDVNKIIKGIATGTNIKTKYFIKNIYNYNRIIYKLVMLFFI